MAMNALTTALAALMLFVSHHALAVEPDELVLVKNKTALFRIVAAESARERVDPKKVITSPLPLDGLPLAIADLAVYTRKSTGAQPEIVIGEGKDDGLINVHIGMTGYVKALGLDFPKPQGFVIAFPDKKNIVIAGAPLEGSEINTRSGVHCFLETYLGVRWLFPGELGEHVPQRDTLVVPAEAVRKIPSFMNRSPGGWHRTYPGSWKKSIEPMRWSQRMGIITHQGLRYSHNIGRIIDPEKYGKTHPHFFPMYDGKRFIPPPSMKRRAGYLDHWEPCYTAEGIVEEGAKQVIEHFDAHPDQSSFAFGINDSAPVCECDKCRDTNRNFPGYCQSQSYYEWVNAVVKKVRETYPDKYFGLIAYSSVDRAPENIVLDAHIVPVLCWDLLYFSDPAIGREKSQKLVEAWSEATPTFGWWAYPFAGAYAVPRFQAHHLGATLKTLYGKGLRVFHSEVYPSPYFKSIPQEYMVWKLLNDITLDPDAILNEWYAVAVGDRAAPHMAAYFAIWEEFWTRRVTTTPWFKDRIGGEKVGAYLQRFDLGYMDVLTEADVRQAREKLDKVVELAETPKQKERTRFFRDGFDELAKLYLVPYAMHAEAQERRPEIRGGKVLYSSDWDAPRRGPDPERQGWGVWQRGYGKIKAYVDKNVGRTKKGSICFDNEESRPTPISLTGYHLPLLKRYVPGKTYAFRVWVKASDPGIRVGMTVRFLKKDDKRLLVGHADFQMSDKLTPGYKAGEWQELRVYFSPPKAGWEDIARVRCLINVAGLPVGQKVWIDDFTIIEAPTDHDGAE
jgi:hypothetical protein